MSTWPARPEDHGSDRYGYVEFEGAPPGVSPAKWFVDEQLAVACQDCNPNLFLRWDPEHVRELHGYPWRVTVAHDDGCPSLVRLEDDGAGG